MEIPYRSLWKTALFTAPLLALGFVSPILIAAELDFLEVWPAFPGAVMVSMLAWTLNIGFLRLRHRLGKWRWLQIFLIGGVMICISGLLYLLFHDLLPKHAERFVLIRYVNAFAVNAIIYVIIDVRLLSLTHAQLTAENTQLRLSSLETQYQILKDQVNPHFLFNALGTARALARRDPALTEAYIIRLSDFLRATLQEIRDDVPLHEELRLVRDYVELQQMRFHEAMVFDCGAEVLEGDYRLPYFSVLTLVENAVKHNAMTVDSPLVIRIRREGLRLTVWNNRQAKALHSPSTGSGLANLRQRCRMLGHGEVEIVELPDSYAVTLQLLPA